MKDILYIKSFSNVFLFFVKKKCRKAIPLKGVQEKA